MSGARETNCTVSIVYVSRRQLWVVEHVPADVRGYEYEATEVGARAAKTTPSIWAGHHTCRGDDVRSPIPSSTVAPTSASVAAAAALCRIESHVQLRWDCVQAMLSMPEAWSFGILYQRYDYKMNEWYWSSDVNVTRKELWETSLRFISHRLCKRIIIIYKSLFTKLVVAKES